MVVLEGGMVTHGSNQYLQPDYLSPLPTTLDAKKSPLALLAQTCSQIGADSPNVKSIVSLDNKNKVKIETPSKSPTAIQKLDKNSPSTSSSSSSSTSSTSSELKLAFKPYETNVLTTLSRKSEDRPSSKDNLTHSENYNSEKMKNSDRVPSRNNRESPQNNNNNELDSGKVSPNVGISDRKTSSPGGSSQRGASPIIRSGLEIMQGHAKDAAMSMYKQAGYGGINPLTGMCCPPGMEQHTNPAFRPPFGGAFSQHHAAMLAAVSGYSNSSAPPGTFVSYARVKTPTGGEALVPVCKDPYCQGCPFSAHNQQMMMGSPCPAGCTQCEHQKYGLAMAAMSQLPQGHPYAQMTKPYICNWISGSESYCGKRFGTSDELLSHLRTHTSNLNDPAAVAALAASTQTPFSSLGSIFPQSALHRAAYNAPLSPLSASRYHPYGKPGGLPPGMQQASFAGFNPAAFPYYSPYALYGQRLGAAAVHQ